MLLSLSIMFSRFIHAVGLSELHSFLWLNNIHNLFTRSSSLDGHLGGVYFLIIMKIIHLSTFTCKFLWRSVFSSFLGIYLEMDSWVICHTTFNTEKSPEAHLIYCLFHLCIMKISHHTESRESSVTSSPYASSRLNNYQPLPVLIHPAFPPPPLFSLQVCFPLSGLSLFKHCPLYC